MRSFFFIIIVFFFFFFFFFFLNCFLFLFLPPTFSPSYEGFEWERMSLFVLIFRYCREKILFSERKCYILGEYFGGCFL